MPIQTRRQKAKLLAPTGTLSHSLEPRSVASKPILDHPDDPPRYTIDLSLTPSERYVELATDFKPILSSTTGLFDDVVKSLYPRVPLSLVRFLSRLMLRNVYNAEETQELRGISKACGVEMYLLVALNTFLDMMMGCTSGGVRTRGEFDEETRMLHFRTLDWEMAILRKLVVQLEFVREQGGSVVARSITYAGFVGVLTGVRPGLSMSLNFRPNHNATSLLAQFRFYSSHFWVLIGRRPSISSVLRRNLLIPILPTIDDITSGIPSVPTTAAYLIFSDGDRTMVSEKDHRTAINKLREDFIVATNHDRADENQQTAGENARNTSSSLGFGEEIIAESVSRKFCIRGKWREAVRRAIGIDPGEHDSVDGNDEDLGVSVTKANVVDWLGEWPITNECTHYAAMMDPKKGDVVWLKRFLEPVENTDNVGSSVNGVSTL